MGSKDWEQTRELWLIALGAALVDPGIREELQSIPSTPLLTPLVEAVTGHEPKTVWAEAEKAWSIKRGERERVIDAVLDELRRRARRRQWKQLVDQAAAAAGRGDEPAVRLAVKKLTEVLG